MKSLNSALRLLTDRSYGGIDRNTQLLECLDDWFALISLIVCLERVYNCEFRFWVLKRSVSGLWLWSWEARQSFNAPLIPGTRPENSLSKDSSANAVIIYCFSNKVTRQTLFKSVYNFCCLKATNFWKISHDFLKYASKTHKINNKPTLLKIYIQTSELWRLEYTTK